MLGIEIAKLHLIWLRLKLTTKPENGLHCPHAPHGINGASIFTLYTVVLKFSYASEPPTGLVGTQIAGPYPQSLRFSRSVVSAKNLYVQKVPR